MGRSVGAIKLWPRARGLQENRRRAGGDRRGVEDRVAEILGDWYARGEVEDPRR
jgi:hypothetical protein